jgi:proton-translocating NADH-quinone oxidoreductase chain M
MTGILSLLLGIPLVGMVAVYGAGRVKESYAKWTALLFSLLAFAISAVLYSGFDNGAKSMQFLESHVWVKSLGISYLVGVDGISLPLVLLTTFLCLAAVGTSWYEIKERPVAYYCLYLLLELGMLGTFVALDFFLFYIFWEIVLVPMFFIIGMWGGPRREYSAIKFFIYTHVASLVMLLGIIAMYLFNGATTFSMLDLSRVTYPWSFAKYVFPALFFGFIVKMPVVPFHTWLPDAHVEAPTPGSVILAGVLLKMGGYGLIRIAIGMMPEAAKVFSPWIAILALISIFYGAFASMAARDMKRLIAYSSVSHMGYVLLGIAAGIVAIGDPSLLRAGATAFDGAIFQMVSHGLISGMLFMMAGLVHHQTHTRIIDELGGLAKKMPATMTALVFASLASLGLPSLSGFVAEFLIFIGSYAIFKIITITAVGVVVVTAAYYLWMLQRMVFGPTRESLSDVLDVRTRELLPAAFLIIFIILLGIYPKPLLDVINASVVSFLGG